LVLSLSLFPPPPDLIDSLFYEHFFFNLLLSPLLLIYLHFKFHIEQSLFRVCL
jgi:hypothetical protein